MSRTLLVMRHAKSDWKTGLSDHERPLNARGQRDAPHMAQTLQQLRLLPELVWVSDSERTLETLAWMNDALGFDLHAQARSGLYLAPANTLLQHIAQTPATVKRVMVLAHNPGVEDLCSLLADEFMRVTTANVGIFDLDITDWREVLGDVQPQATLREMLRPREL